MFCLEELADRLGVSWVGDGRTRIGSLRDLEDAEPDSLAPLLRDELLQAAERSRAGAFLCAEHLRGVARPQLISATPRETLAKLLMLFFPERERRSGVHPTAIVDDTASVHDTAWVGPFCVVERGAKIAQGAQLIAASFVGEYAVVGGDVTIGPHAAVLDGVCIGARSRVGPGAVVGYDGFGYASSAEGWRLVPSAGDVQIGEDVDLGANSCVDRGTLGSTRIADGVKIDNLVQVAHNCRLGARSLICALSGLAGSVRLGVGVILGGQVGIADHVQVGEGARIAGHSGVIGDVVPHSTVAGFPAVDRQRWLRQSASLGKLGEVLMQVRRLVRSHPE